MSEQKVRNRPEISVIVPVYKVERYLNECIDSILAQTFTDFELILVDDGSPDRSGAMCDACELALETEREQTKQRLMKTWYLGAKKAPYGT